MPFNLAQNNWVLKQYNVMSLEFLSTWLQMKTDWAKYESPVSTLWVGLVRYAIARSFNNILQSWSAISTKGTWTDFFDK